MRLFRVIVFGLIALANLSVFLLIGSGFNLFQCIFCMLIVIPELVAIKNKKEIKYPKPLYIFATLFAALIVGWFSCCIFGFGKMGIYSLKVKFADNAGYTANHFPQAIPEGAKLLDMGLLPTIMQGDGNVHATFSCDEDTIAELEKKASDRAIMTFTIKQYLDGDIPDEYYDMAKKILNEKLHFEDMEPDIRINASRIIMDQQNIYYDHYGKQTNKELNDVMIYIIDSNFYWNHLRTDSVVVDRTQNIIEYVGM